jgi:hypothetical protein
VLFVFSLCYLYLTPGYESKLPRARTGTVPRRLTLGVTLNHKSNLVPSETIGPPHHMSVGLYEAMGMSTFFSLWRDGGNQQPAKIFIYETIPHNIHLSGVLRCQRPSSHHHHSAITIC